MRYQSIILFLCIIWSSNGTIVKLKPTASFNMPINFRHGKLPCSRETVVFPKTMLTSIKIESDTSVSGFILPKEGDISLADVTIFFGADETEANCTHDGNVYYVESYAASWSQPDIWSSPRFNDATPDADRVPCFDDIIELTDDFTLTLPDQTQTVAGLIYKNYTAKTNRDLYRIYSQLQDKLITNKFFLFGITIEKEQCQSRAGCPCQKDPVKIKCDLKYCAVPTCIYPIKPEGHCCKICGGVISFEISESFDIMTFKELVEETVDSYGTSNLVYYLGRLPNNKVQVIVVDKSEYSGISAQVINAIDRKMQRHWVEGAKLVDISGSPLDRSGLGWKIFISMFFVVVLIMAGIYVYYYKLSDVSDLRFPILNSGTSGVFLRFQRRTDSVVCLTRSDSDAAIGRSAGTAFRNPLYDSKRQRDEVEETGSEG